MNIYDGTNKDEQEFYPLPRGVATVQLYDCEDNKLLGEASVRVE